MKSRAGQIGWLMMLAMAGAGEAQVRFGDLSMDLTGNIAGGYTGSYGNLTPSDHGFTAGGSGTLTGFYHDPNFLSFSVLPFYNQSRANSGYQSITDASGVSATTSIFAGSQFPGSITYSKTFNSEGSFGFPGLPNFTSHGDADVFGITWGAFLSGLPTLSVSYQQGANDYSLYGTSGNSVSNFRTFSAASTYTLYGFNLSGSYHFASDKLQIPSYVSGESRQKSISDTNSFNAGVGHSLPLNGSISGAASRSDISSEYTLGQYNATLDSLTAGLSFVPIDRLHVGANAQYLDNLTGALDQSILAAGGQLGPSQPQQSSHSLDVTGYGNYEVQPWHTTFAATDEHRNQVFFGQSFQSNTVTGTATYANFLLGGFVTGTVGVTRTSIAPSNVSSLGVLSSINYARQIRRWVVNGSFHYDQNAQTILVSYTTSGYGYTASAGRKIGRRSRFTASANGSKSGLNNQAGSTNFAQSYSASLSTRYLSVTGAYSRSSGNSILTANGLVPTPVPLPVLAPGAIILYGGHAYSVGVGSSPIRGLTISGSYAKAYAGTQGQVLSTNKTEQANAYIQYQVRKIYLNAGYSRLLQSISTSGTPPQLLVSYYVGLSRWFNFF